MQVACDRSDGNLVNRAGGMRQIALSRLCQQTLSPPLECHPGVSGDRGHQPASTRVILPLLAAVAAKLLAIPTPAQAHKISPAAGSKISSDSRRCKRS